MLSWPRVAVARRDELGDHHAVEDARELRHVLTQRPGGTLAALEAAPEPDVLFGARSGARTRFSPALHDLVAVMSQAPGILDIEARWETNAGASQTHWTRGTT